jgi:cytochrome P450
MKSFQLHTADNRKELFAGLSPRVWLEADLVRTWVVADSTLALKLLRHPLVIIASRAGILDTINEKFGMEFPAVAYACKVLPVLAEDDAHAAVRKDFATYLAERLRELEPRLAEFSGSCLRRLSRKGNVDIVSEVIDPFVHKVISVLIRTEAPAEILALDMADALFFNTMVTRLQTLEARIDRAVSFLRTESCDENEVAWKFTCLVFGVDSLSGTLTESVVSALRELDPRGTDTARLPDFPVETGVPVTMRMAGADFALAGIEFKAGDAIRLQLQSFSYSDNVADRQFIFGAGMHSCVGKQLSLRLWQSFKQEFDRLGLKARILDYRLARSHFLMLHKRVNVEVL